MALFSDQSVAMGQSRYNAGLFLHQHMINPPMISDREFKRICWASRRGMLELDLLLVPFVEQRFARLSAADQQTYIRLLEGEDNDLFAWLLGHKQSDDPQLAAMVQQIVNFNRAEKHDN